MQCVSFDKQLTAKRDLLTKIPRDFDAMSQKSCSALQVPCAALQCPSVACVGLPEVCNDEICILGIIFVPEGGPGATYDRLRPAR